MKRRQLILLPILTLSRQRASATPLLMLLGSALWYLFKKVLDVGLDLLVKSAYNRYFGEQSQATTQRQEIITVAYSSPKFANEYCPWDTISYAKNGKRFWDGKMFLPNELNANYSHYGSMDSALKSLVLDSEKRYLLDASRNRAAYIRASSLNEVIRKVSEFEQAKAKLFWQIEQGALEDTHIAPYLVSPDAIDEIDKCARFSANHTAFDPRYHNATEELRRLATWYNFRLLAARKSAGDVTPSKLDIG